MQRMASALLGQDVQKFVAKRRPGKSWRRIARDLYEATNGAVDVTPESIRNWVRGKDAA